jgi:hypothetical protein
MKKMIWTAMMALTLGYGSPLAHTADAEAKNTDGAFDLSFAGGTTKELVNEMEKASGLKLNVLIPQELTDANVPPMELRSVSVQSVFDALNVISRSSNMMWIRQPNSGNGNIWVLARSPDNRKTQAFYVGHLLKKFTINDITTAVANTWELSGHEVLFGGGGGAFPGGGGGRTALSSTGHLGGKMMYHPETQLLIALGQPEQLNTTSNVLAQLELAIEPVQTEPGKTDRVKSADEKRDKSAAQP